MKKVIVLIILSLTINIKNSFGQNTSTDPALKQAALKANQQRQTKKSQSFPNSASTSPSTNPINSSKSFQINENDIYQGRKDEFLSQLIVSELPSDFPKYEKWMGVRHYNEIIDEYYKKNPSILKDIVRIKLTGK